MTSGPQYSAWRAQFSQHKKCLAVLLDPEKTLPDMVIRILERLPHQTTHIFVGGSTVPADVTQDLVMAVKQGTDKPVWLFPGDYTQVTPEADALLFLSLLSGNNPEYLIGQQAKAAPFVQKSGLEVISTAYLLLDGGHQSAVARVSQTQPMPTTPVSAIVDRALAGMFMGAQCIYLEAGSGALKPVPSNVIQSVKDAVNIPLIVGGGMRSDAQAQQAYAAGADMVVMGTVFEDMMRP